LFQLGLHVEFVVALLVDGIHFGSSVNKVVQLATVAALFASRRAWSTRFMQIVAIAVVALVTASLVEPGVTGRLPRLVLVLLEGRFAGIAKPLYALTKEGVVV
jgi:hypothetical protein